MSDLAEMLASAKAQGYKEGRADALSIDMDKPMHFTDEQKAWIKNYIIINAKRQRADAFSNCKLDSGEYCWQDCCATEQCGKCSRLNNGQIDYFDNTFATNDLSYADMPTTP